MPRRHNCYARLRSLLLTQLIIKHQQRLRYSAPSTVSLMLKIYNCIATAHDLKLVVLAAISACWPRSPLAINLLHHARRSHGQMRNAWLAVSAISTGFGIWATHFVAMLAFTPGIPSGYNISLTILSLVAAILLTGSGLAVSLIATWRHGPWLGGAIVGGGIAAMHYTGMAAFEVAGMILWDPVLVTASIVAGAVIGAIALPVGLHSPQEKWKAGGAVLLTLAIVSHHFTAMGAVSIIPDPTTEISPSALPAWCAGDRRRAGELRHHRPGAGRRRARRARPPPLRARSRPDARSRQCLGGRARGLRRRDHRPRQHQLCRPDRPVAFRADRHRLDGCFPDRTARAALLSGSGQPVETAVRQADGTTTPVELILRSIDFAGRPHQVDRRARSAGAQGGRAAHPLPRPSRRADRRCPTAAISTPGSTRRSRRSARANVSPCSASTSTASRKSTTCSATPRATPCCRPPPRASPRCWTSARSWRGSAATNSPS